MRTEKHVDNHQVSTNNKIIMLLVSAIAVTVFAIGTLWLVSFGIVSYVLGIAISFVLFGISPILWMAFIVSTDNPNKQ